MATRIHEEHETIEEKAARREAREADRIEPRAKAIEYDTAQNLVLVALKGGCVFGFPPEEVPGLAGAEPDQLAKVRLSPSRDGLHWDELDAHASLTGLVAKALNLREWAPRIMGQVRSEAKAKAARENGKKGGRPRKTGKERSRAGDQ